MGCLGALFGMIFAIFGSVLGLVFGIFGSIIHLLGGLFSGVFFGLPLLLLVAIIWFLVILFRQPQKKDSGEERDFDQQSNEKSESSEISIDVDDWEEVEDGQKD